MIANPRLPMKRSWPCSTSYGRASGLESIKLVRFMEMAQRVCEVVCVVEFEVNLPDAFDDSRRAGLIIPHTPFAAHQAGFEARSFHGRILLQCDGSILQGSQAKATRGKTASTGRTTMGPAPAGLRVGSSVVGSRTATSERMDATVGRDRQPSFDSANSFSVIGSARGTSAMLHPGVVDGSTTNLAGRDSGDRAERRSLNSVSDGERASSLPSGESDPLVTLDCTPSESECRSESNQRQSRNGWDQRSRKTIYRRIGVVSRLAIGRTMASCGLLGSLPGTLSERGAVMRCIAGKPGPQADFTSGDGLGVQQPGSMTCGFASRRQPASGRADESATCPAVARNYRRAA